MFLAPIGDLNAPCGMGKSLMPDPERAPLVRRAFEEDAPDNCTQLEATPIRPCRTVGINHTDALSA